MSKHERRGTPEELRAARGRLDAFVKTIHPGLDETSEAGLYFLLILGDEETGECKLVTSLESEDARDLLLHASTTIPRTGAPS